MDQQLEQIKYGEKLMELGYLVYLLESSSDNICISELNQLISAKKQSLKGSGNEKTIDASTNTSSYTPTTINKNLPKNPPSKPSVKVYPDWFVWEDSPTDIPKKTCDEMTQTTESSLGSKIAVATTQKPNPNIKHQTKAFWLNISNKSIQTKEDTPVSNINTQQIHSEINSSLQRNLNFIEIAKRFVTQREFIGCLE